MKIQLEITGHKTIVTYNGKSSEHNSVWIKNRNLRADSNDPNMFDLSQWGDDALEILGVKAERIAAGEKYVRRFGMASDVLEHCVYIPEALLSRSEEHPLAKTITAYPLADVAHQQQNCGRIFVFHSGHNRVCLFIGGIDMPPGLQFAQVRDHNTPQRIIRIIPVNQRQIVFIAPKRIFIRYRPESVTLRWSQFLQLIYIRHIIDFDKNSPFNTILYYYSSFCCPLVSSLSEYLFS